MAAGDEKNNQVRLFKRSAWQSVSSVNLHGKNVKKPGLGYLREATIISEHAAGLILDAGLGTGRISNYMRSLGKSVFSLDISTEMLSKQNDHRFCICGDIESLPFKDGTFDTVSAIWVLLHFPNWKDILKEFIRVLGNGGVLLFEISSKEHIDWAEKYAPNVRKKYACAENFEAFISVKELCNELKKHSTKVEHVIPYSFFNSNELLMCLTNKNKDQEMLFKEILRLRSESGVQEFWLELEEIILSWMPPGLTHKNFIVARKGRDTGPLESYIPVTFTQVGQLLNHVAQILDEKCEEIILTYLDVHYHSRNLSRKVYTFYRKISEFFSPFIAIDPISLAAKCDVKKLISELHSGEYNSRFKQEFGCESKEHEVLKHSVLQKEFSYWAEKLVTTWYNFQPEDSKMAICDVPIGPVMEYDLIKDIIVNSPPSMYLNWAKKVKQNGP